MTKRTTNFRANKPLQWMIGWYVIFWAALAVAPRDRSDWLLENLLVFVTVGFLIFTYRTFPLSNLSYLLITIFLTLHTVGAHYTYAHVPLGDWLRDLLGLSRNHFDRLVHFAFGLLLSNPVREMLQGVAKTSAFWNSLLTLSLVMSASSLFEKLEMWVALLVSPELGTAYLGTQGDVWDAQQDMTAAMVGSLLALAVMVAAREKRVALRPIFSRVAGHRDEIPNAP